MSVVSAAAETEERGVRVLVDVFVMMELIEGAFAPPTKKADAGDVTRKRAIKILGAVADR